MLVISHMLHGSRWIVLDGHSKSGLFWWRRRHLWDSENQRARPHELTSRSCSLIGMGSRSLHDRMNPPYASPVCHNAHNLTFCNTVIKDEIKPGVENFQAVWFRDRPRPASARQAWIDPTISRQTSRCRGYTSGGYHLMTDRLVLSAKPNNILGSDTGSDDS